MAWRDEGIALWVISANYLSPARTIRPNHLPEAGSFQRELAGQGGLGTAANKNGVFAGFNLPLLAGTPNSQTGRLQPEQNGL